MAAVRRRRRRETARAADWRVWLMRGLQRQTGGGRGLTNTVVARLARLFDVGKRFWGVYPADCLPRSMAAEPHFAAVVNLGRWKTGSERSRVGHFVAVVGRPRKVFYVDSYGLPCTQPDVLRFLAGCQRPVEYCKRAVQSFDSKACGLYALLFSLYLYYDLDFALRFRRSDLEKNDKKMIKYLKRISHLVL